jgi:hypothetical protein
MVWKIWIEKPRGLLAVDFFGKIAIKKGIFDIELMYWPLLGDSERKNDMNGGGFYYGAKSLVKIDAGLLGETSDHPASFMASKRAIRIMLVAEDPFAGDDVGA